MKQSHKTLLLWALLVGLMAFIYAMNRGAGVSPFVAGLVLGAIVLVAVLFGRHGRRANAANQEGVRLLGLGRPSAALEQFRAAIVASDQPAFHFNAAVAETQLFRLTRARDALDALAKRRPPEPLRTHIANQLVLVDTLLGTATDAIVASFSDRDAALARLLDACVAVRTDRFARAEVILAEPVIKQLGGYLRALADVLSAWCAHELRGERRAVDRVSLFGEADPEGLLEHWPELRAFLNEAP